MEVAKLVFWYLALIMIWDIASKLTESLKYLKVDRRRLTTYDEEKIIKHLDFIINEALDEYVLFNIQPKDIYYINSKMEQEITDYLSDKVPEMISDNIKEQLSYIYRSSYIGKYIGKRIYMIVLNWVLEYNIANRQPEDKK